MTATPAISVIMPAHDAEPYVGEAIGSILDQTFRDLELIIVVDASTDATGAIARDAAGRDDRVVVLDVDVRSAAGSRNVGLQHARGRLVALMDADDVARPERLRRQVEAAERVPEAVLWGCYMQRVTEEGLPMDLVAVGCRTVEEFERLDRTRSLIRLYGTVAMFPRDLALRAGGFDRRFEPLEDSELWDRIALHGPALVVPEVLQDYRQHDASLSVRRIDRQRRVYRYITARHAARLEGRELTFEEFERLHPPGSPLRSLDGLLRGISQRHGRRYRIALARRRYVTAAGSFVLMLASHPGRFLRRLLPGAPHV